MQINLSLQTLSYTDSMKASYAGLGEHRMIIISVLDDKGQRIGLGECAPTDLSHDSDAYIRMSDVASLINDALKSNDYAEHLRPYPALLFALESAIYDYQHKNLLYDTPFAKSEVGIPLCATIPPASYDDMLKQVKRSILHGFRSIKLDALADWSELLKLIDKVRGRFTADTLEIRIDAKGMFSVADAKAKLSELAGYSIHSVEQPIDRYQWKEMAQLCSESPVAIAIGCELTGVNDITQKRMLLDTIKPQYIAVTPMLHGGMAGSIEWIHEAQQRGIRSWLSGAHEGNIGMRNVALLVACVYGDRMLAQDFADRQLYSDNIEMDMELRKGRLWRCEVAE